MESSKGRRRGHSQYSYRGPGHVRSQVRGNNNYQQGSNNSRISQSERHLNHNDHSGRDRDMSQITWR